MVAIMLSCCVFFGLMLDHAMAEEFVTKAEFESLKHRMDNLEASLDTTMYSFSVRLHEDTVLSDAPCVFGTVDLNIGDGYDGFTGAFNAPASGVYLLTVYGRNLQTSYGTMYIKKNDEILCHVEIGDGATWNMGSCTVIVELTPEDTVRVTGISGGILTIQASTSGFAGHLIQEYV